MIPLSSVHASFAKKGGMSAVDVVKSAIEKHKDKVAVGWSGGRASTVILRMALDIDPDVKAIFEDTGVEYPATYDFIKRMTKEWNVNLTTTKPLMTFWECVKKYGYPKIRTEKNHTPKCCSYLKERPLAKAVKEMRITALIDGIQACESHMRKMVIGYRGQSYYAKSAGVWKYHPIAYWSQKELKDYIANNDLPVNEAYGKYQIERTGCWPCTGYLSWERVMVKTNPKFFALMKERMGQRIMEHYFNSQVAPCGERA